MKGLFILFALSSILVFGACEKTEEKPSLQVADVKIIESNATQKATLKISISSTFSKEVKFNYKTTDVSAKAGLDYVSKSGTVVIAAGSKTAEIEFEILGDTAVEIEETFWVSFSGGENVNIPTPFVTIKISNDDVDDVSNSDGYNTPKTYSGYSLVWADEFDGTELNMSNWSYDVGRGDWGWGNNELQYYQSGTKNAQVKNGKLIITARKETVGDAEYTSARIKTQGKKSFTHGRIDIRAKLLKGQGLWPALWMLGENITSVGWPACGEIDIMEMVGQTPNKVYGTAHWGTQPPSTWKSKEYFLPSGNFSDEFHVFSIIWVKDKIQWYVDDKLIHTIGSADVNVNYPFNSPFFFIFNVAVGGAHPGNPDINTPFPNTMEVDFVRVFQ